LNLGLGYLKSKQRLILRRTSEAHNKSSGLKIAFQKAWKSLNGTKQKFFKHIGQVIISIFLMSEVIYVKRELKGSENT
jgi:hypothetical protein